MIYKWKEAYIVRIYHKGASRLTLIECSMVKTTKGDGWINQLACGGRSPRGKPVRARRNAEVALTAESTCTLEKCRGVGHNLQSVRGLALVIVAKHSKVTRRCLNIGMYQR